MDLLTLDLPGIPKIASGKVREIFDLGDHLLLVATDRISAFDCILPNPIPRKGEVLNLFSAFWFGHFDFVPNHVLISNVEHFPAALQPFTRQLLRRSMVVLKAQPLPVECVVRGYLAGSGWKEYQATQSICGIAPARRSATGRAVAGTDLHPLDQSRQRTRRKHPVGHLPRTDRRR